MTIANDRRCDAEVAAGQGQPRLQAHKFTRNVLGAWCLALKYGTLVDTSQPRWPPRHFEVTGTTGRRGPSLSKRCGFGWLSLMDNGWVER